MQLVQGGQTAININGEIGPFFRNARGVRQGEGGSRPLATRATARGIAAIFRLDDAL
jgi:hypothetical protein